MVEIGARIGGTNEHQVIGFQLDAQWAERPPELILEFSEFCQRPPLNTAADTMGRHWSTAADWKPTELIFEL